MYCADFHTEKSGVKSQANFDALGFNDLKKPWVILICGISDIFWYGLFAGLDPSMSLMLIFFKILLSCKTANNPKRENIWLESGYKKMTRHLL